MPLSHTQCSFGYNDERSDMMAGMENNSVPKLESFHMTAQTFSLGSLKEII